MLFTPSHDFMGVMDKEFYSFDQGWAPGDFQPGPGFWAGPGFSRFELNIPARSAICFPYFNFSVFFNPNNPQNRKNVLQLGFRPRWIQKSQKNRKKFKILSKWGLQTQNLQKNIVCLSKHPSHIVPLSKTIFTNSLIISIQRRKYRLAQKTLKGQKYQNVVNPLVPKRPRVDVFRLSP